MGTTALIISICTLFTVLYSLIVTKNTLEDKILKKLIDNDTLKEAANKTLKEVLKKHFKDMEKYGTERYYYHHGPYHYLRNDESIATYLADKVTEITKMEIHRDRGRAEKSFRSQMLGEVTDKLNNLTGEDFLDSIVKRLRDKQVG